MFILSLLQLCVSVMNKVQSNDVTVKFLIHILFITSRIVSVFPTQHIYYIIIYGIYIVELGVNALFISNFYIVLPYCLVTVTKIIIIYYSSLNRYRKTMTHISTKNYL